MKSYIEATARQRIHALIDGFTEFLPPSKQWTSPHLPQLNAPVSFDDGVIIGVGHLGDHRVFAAAQEGGFMGGAVGEVHGAKLVGLMRRAVLEKPAAVVLLAESGGVRLHEANAGLIAVSEVMRAVFAVRAAGIPVVVINGGSNGCFGGMGIVARCTNVVIMSEEARLAMSGPEVIETANGVEEFDSKDRALVWRTTGGKHRYLMGDCQMLVADDVTEFKEAAKSAIDNLVGKDAASVSLSLAGLEQEQGMMAQRIAAFGDCREPMDIWKKLGIAAPEQIAMLDAAAFRELVAAQVPPQHPQPSGAPVHLSTPVAKDEVHQDQPAYWREIASQLFPQGHTITESADFLSGTAEVGGVTISVVGTTAHTPIGVEIALRQAQAVLETIRAFPQRPLLLMVDTQGQRLRHRDEMLGINSYMAHLGKCLELARQLGHRIIALVYDQALSGGFITSGMMADACYALPAATIRVMGLPAMARITKVPEERITELAKDNPVFAPGPLNYERMGGVEAVWEGGLATQLQSALAHANPVDQRIATGATRGGRSMAQKVVNAVLSEPVS